MNPFDLKLIGFELAMVLPFLLGYILYRRFRQLSKVANKLVILNLTAFEPPIIFWSIWGLALRGEMFILPLAGLIMVITGFCLGKLMTPLLIPDSRHCKTFVISSSLANHGFTMGGVICYLFLGEKGLALSAIFITYFIPYTMLFIFFYAGIGKNTHRIDLKYIVNFLINIRNMPLFSLFAAIVLRLLNIDRPTIAFPLNSLLAVSIALYYFTLGINFVTGDLKAFKLEQALLAGIKFILIPMFTFLLIQGLDLNADIRQVILIESFMPVAVYAVVTSILFDLKIRLASSLFIINSILFIIVLLPLFYLLNQ